MSRAERRAKGHAVAEELTIKLWRSPDTPASLLLSSLNTNPASRPHVAANPGAPLELLEQLAELGNPEVDTALAANPTWTNRPGA